MSMVMMMLIRDDIRTKKNVSIRALPEFGGVGFTLARIFLRSFLASQDAQEVMLVTLSVSESALADFTDVTLVSEDAVHNSLQMSSSRDLTDVSEDAAHNSF